VIVRQFVSDLRTIVGREQLHMAVELAKGTCGTVEDYKKRCGFISGMERALQLAEELTKKLDGDETEEAA